MTKMQNTNLMKRPSRAGLVLRPLMLAAGLSTLGLGGIAYAAADQDEGKDHHAKKVIVVRSDVSTTVSKDGRIVVDNSNVSADVDPDYVQTVRAKALHDAHEALEKVEARIKKTRSTDDRAALEIARDSLKGAIDALEAAPTTYIYNGVDPFDLDDGDLQASLKELRLHEGKLKGMRIELHRDLEAARSDIAEALEGLEVEVDTKGDITRLRIKDLKDAAAHLDRSEEEQLRALERAQAEIERARADLEKRIEEKKARDAEKAPKH